MATLHARIVFAIVFVILCGRAFSLTFGGTSKFSEELDEHRRRLNAFVDTADSTVPFILYRPPARAGLANRLVSLVSAFSLALATKRVFIVDTTSGVQYALSKLYTARQPALFVDLKVARGIIRNIDRTKSTRDGPLDGRRWPFWSHVSCSPNLHIALPKRVAISSTQFWLPLIRYNPHYQEIFKEWFGTESVFGLLYTALLDPTPEIQVQIDAFRTENFNEHNIAIQIRRSEKEFVKADSDRWFWACARHIAQDYDPSSVTFFLATDTDAVKQAAPHKLAPYKVVFREDPYSRTSGRGIVAALIDLHLLGDCDEMVATTYSSFGAIAAARTGVVPHVVTKASTCVRMLRSEPVFHYWRDYTRQAATCMDMDSPDIAPYMLNNWNPKW
mmetsp:Transcript_4674/g.7237  ORF Transcript_4674/g.7237 Transcript_4674/m.7237 type:complete len:388 (-) Transcript_4674:542-1705(-)|eukprot:CAMPEP_0184337390 /NCGR_PEP_ID=MMETSP1089-20130417/5772_1 /TAXON_ID=38269 ORGANISM="Gloeochaete wittrockiana, Strain SAG46.84" /NCGR_SAMPLE_ID=MMETSP1089 /ASSEMBLY_ACC=CAM_ASM_000445 /LENGTH=387 /DNA_ID=CAMNT_0026663067 /DNA_START=34 /DNA_END=1197 /DNA_ORIENTATION=-